MDHVKYGDFKFPVGVAESVAETLQEVLNKLKYKTGTTYNTIQGAILQICASLPDNSDTKTELVNNYYIHLERKHGIACFGKLSAVKYNPAAHVVDEIQPVW